MAKAANPARKSIGKKQRFAIFARDKFTCRYCGRPAGEVTLVLDHLIPVRLGGTSDEPNLITSCEHCNQGKGGQKLEDAAPTEDVRLLILQQRQEQKEQMQAALAAKEASQLRRDFEQEIVNYLCEAVGKDSVKKTAVQILTSFARRHGPALVFEWIDLAKERTGGLDETRLCKYVCGIRRKLIEEEGLEDG